MLYLVLAEVFSTVFALVALDFAVWIAFYDESGLPDVRRAAEFAGCCLLWHFNPFSLYLYVSFKSFVVDVRGRVRAIIVYR